MKDDIGLFLKRYDEYPDLIGEHNEEIVRKRVVEIDSRINPVEGRNLDRQQLSCIAYDTRTRLVIAGAGTGKTTAIVGLVKDLILSGKAAPHEILLLSFTNASVTELRGRIAEETGERIEVSTFHRLGLKVIASVNGKVPKVSNADLTDVILEGIESRKTDPSYVRILNQYMAYDFDSDRDEGDFETGSKMNDYLMHNPLYTLNGEKVKSYGESDIANFLALNGVPYAYEESYKFDTNDSQFGQYHPDFHIKGTDIYIEYFGIDKNGNVAPFMTDANPNAAKEYREGMEWKRRLHEEKGTVMIELFAYQRSNGTLLQSLEEQLKAHGVELIETSPEGIYDRMFGKDERKLKTLASTFATAILLIKGFGRPWDEVFPRDYGFLQKKKMERLESIIRPLYDDYQKLLQDNNEIDFEDMLNTAAGLIRDGRHIHNYRYVIVDEYQDLSRSRYNLLKSMRDSKEYRLFCVGDDWQSIYRFNGCDVSYILDFPKYWGPSTIRMIETTYRFSGEILEKSSNFICRNKAQFQKHLVGANGSKGRVIPIIAPSSSGIRDRIAEALMKVPKGKKVLFLGRYNHDVNVLSEDGFSWKPLVGDKSITVKYSGRPDLDMRFMTIHSSKGLQADVVFSLNNMTGSYGFPSNRPEPLIITLLLGGKSTQYDEERRLFYVAMTRAKKAAYIVTKSGHQSDFFKEIFPFNYGKGRAFICPICGGVLVARNGNAGMFYGCSNYSSKGCKYTRKMN